jgi:NAD(P)-dependent dehydrogenase (short-subunit alcohol dehydrogenase family)
MEPMSNVMKGKTVILAGGSGGLGAAVAEMLAQQGAIPVIGYLQNRARADSLSKKISSEHGFPVPTVPGDILDGSVRQRLIAEARQSGELYGLVPLIGNPARVPIETATEQDFIESMRTNFIGPVLLARDFAAAVGDHDASIVFISTMQGTGVFPGSTVYAAPKAALVHTARILAKQWTVRVNVVAPGVNNAGMAEQSVRSGKYDTFIEKKAIPRFGDPADVARAVLFFLEADNYVTGQVLTVDGGLSLKM